MLTIQLPEEIERQLEDLATASGQTTASLAEEAIIEYLGDKIDIAIAERRLLELREGKSTTILLQDLVKQYALDD